MLLDSLRRLALAGTVLARTTCGGLRLKRLKLGAQVKLSVRRIKIALASTCPYQEEWGLAYARLTQSAPYRPSL